MRGMVVFGFLIGAAVAPLAAQPPQIQIGLDDLAAKAKESVNISLDAAMLKLAGAFFSGGKKDKSSDADAGTQKLISGLKNITVKSFTFDQEGLYKLAELDPVRAQLRTAGWGKMVGVQEKGELTEVYTKSDGGQIAGLAVLAAEPKELTVVYIEGNIDLAKLADLAGHFGIPALPGIPGQKSDSSKKEDQQ